MFLTAMFGGMGTALAQTPISPPTMASTAPIAAPAKPRLIPTADFARDPLVSGPQLSPDGKRLLGQFQLNGRKVIGIHSFLGEKRIMIGLPTKQDLRWYRWAGNSRILVSIARTVPWFGDEAVMTRLISIDVATKAMTVLGSKTEGLEGDDLLYVDPKGEWALLSFQKTIYDYPSVSRVELATNKIREVVAARDDVWEWYADSDGVVRAGIGFREISWSTIYRTGEAERFRKIGTARYDDEDAAYDIIRFVRGSDEGFVLSNKETGRFALYKFNFATKLIGERVFASDTNDITDFDTTEDGKNIRSVSYTDDRDRIIWFDTALKTHQANLDAALKNNANWIVSTNRDKSAMLVWTGSASNPGSYYIFRPAEGVMNRVAKINETLAPSELAPTRYIKYKARDGLEISGYLTLPVGRDPKNLPLVILPHGGPYGVRDKLAYDPEVQFLANRGYVVLQPNYRGSDGYGKIYYEKGEGQWGRAMQDDLDDGMDWLAKDGIVDPKRVCIVGSSYGGYAALWGATRNPERYRCAASWAGVSDVKRQLRYQLDFGISRRYRKNWRATVQGEDKFDLRTVSPLFAADQLKVPVLVMHGDADQTVPYKQSKLYADALAKAGKAHEFYTINDEGHSFSSRVNLKEWLDRIDAFLAKHNPA
jgi:dipeptidyl aminopeptidase/acylaminoacyl peptidase